ncbi:YncE family protein [Sabulibacter ruber]|uniref:YncE family protein n=1 Tax=Sabulibacter ruber TaxID=2811901 RepID=UPI001A977E2D|nr:DUF5074 domain-containing protein [Sabulibacter ruber]
MKRFPRSKQLFFGLSLASSLLALSCKEEKKEVLPTYSAGVLISSTNANGTANGVISFYDRATGTVTEPDLFNKVNGRPLDGNAMAMTSAFEKMYLITSGNRIEILNSNSLTTAGSIEGLTAPQKLVAINSRTAFVSEGVDPKVRGWVSLVNLSTKQVVDTTTVGKAPGPMAVAGNRLFVACTGENMINVINIATNALEGRFTVGDAPNSMVVDGSGFLWVLSSGNKGTTSGSLRKFVANNLTIAPEIYTFANATLQPHSLTLSASRNRLYFIYDGVYVMDVNAKALPAQPLIKRRFETLGQDPTDGLLYFSKAPQTGSEGWVIRYRNTGAAVDSFQVQGTPNWFSFR